MYIVCVILLCCPRTLQPNHTTVRTRHLLRPIHLIIIIISISSIISIVAMSSDNLSAGTLRASNEWLAMLLLLLLRNVLEYLCVVSSRYKIHVVQLILVLHTTTISPEQKPQTKQEREAE